MSRSAMRTALAVVALALAVLGSAARASITIDQLNSNFDGTIQFIVLGRSGDEHGRGNGEPRVRRRPLPHERDLQDEGRRTGAVGERSADLRLATIVVRATARREALATARASARMAAYTRDSSTA